LVECFESVAAVDVAVLIDYVAHAVFVAAVVFVEAVSAHGFVVVGDLDFHEQE